MTFVPLSAAVVRRQQATWTSGLGPELGVHGAGEVRGNTPSLVYRLPAPRFVHAIRFRYLYWDFAPGVTGTHLRVFWKNGPETFTDQGRNGALLVWGGEAPAIFWINAVVDEIRIDPADVTCRFVFSQMTLVVPDREEAAGVAANNNAPRGRWVPFSGVPVQLTQTTWGPDPSAEGQVVSGVGKVSGETPSIVFRLPARQYVHALRFKASYWDLADTARKNSLRVLWKNDAEAFTDQGRCESVDVPGQGESDIVVLLDGFVDEIRIDPANLPCWFTFRDMSMVVPEAAPDGEKAIETAPH
jgi:hypothetical protein